MLFRVVWLLQHVEEFFKHCVALFINVFAVIDKCSHCIVKFLDAVRRLPLWFFSFLRGIWCRVLVNFGSKTLSVGSVLNVIFSLPKLLFITTAGVISGRHPRSTSISSKKSKVLGKFPVFCFSFRWSLFF